jgi:hypothetical protein
MQDSRVAEEAGATSSVFFGFLFQGNQGNWEVEYGNKY